MPKHKEPEDLSVEELRRLLLAKRRVSRKERLDHFRRTGRAVMLAPDVTDTSLESLHSSPVMDTSEVETSDKPETPPRRRWLDRSLLAVEVLAVMGLVSLGVIFFGMLRDLNRESAAALVQPTMTSTPLVTAVVLPSGHVPPDEQGNTRPNDAEIPEHLRPMVQSLASLAIPTAGPEQAIRIQIPALSVDAPIVQGDGWEQLKKGVGQHIGSTNPGQKGNLVLAAHNDVYGQIFRELDRLNPGDQIIVYTQLRQYVYTVTRTTLVEPTQVEVMAPTTDATVTLISCYPYLIDTQRIVVAAKLQNP